MCIAGVTACSDKDGDSDPTPPEAQGDFSLTAPDGTFYTNGQTVSVTSVDATGTMRLEFGVKNNTKKQITLTMGQKIVSSNYAEIAKHATFCWDACYSQLPLSDGFTANQPVAAGGAPLGAPSGDIMYIDAATPSFEAKVEYTVTNSATGEKRTLVGLYKYTKK